MIRVLYSKISDAFNETRENKTIGQRRCNLCGENSGSLYFDCVANPNKINDYGFDLMIRDACCEDSVKSIEKFRKEYTKLQFLKAIEFIDKNSTPKIYKPLRLDDFKDNTPVYNKIHSMIKSYPDSKGLFVYSRNNGTGKTALSTVYAKTITAFKGAKKYQFMNYPEFVNKYEQLGFQDKEDYLNSFKKAKVLVIDDLGKGRSTNQSITNIYDIVNYRVNNGMIVICNSNLSLSEIGKEFDSSVASRLYEMCDIIEMKGKDKRISN